MDNVEQRMFDMINGGFTARYDFKIPNGRGTLYLDSVQWGYYGIPGDDRRKLILSSGDKRNHIVGNLVFNHVSGIEIMRENKSGVVYAVISEDREGNPTKHEINIDVPRSGS